MPVNKNIKDISGKRYGRLTVLSYAYSKNRTTFWNCKCDCGNETIIRKNSLTNGDTISCGCYRKEHKHEYGFKHGKSHEKIYNSWAGMKSRCLSKNHSKYKNYGGRGITICEEWLDFNNFYDWAILNGYKEGLSIDRINVNGNYEPHNCRWSDRKTQMNNKTNNRYIEYGGQIKTITEWASELGIKTETLRYRIFIANWDLKKAFETLPNAKLLIVGDND